MVEGGSHFSSNISFTSSRKKLNSRGLRLSPCFRHKHVNILGSKLWPINKLWRINRFQTTDIKYPPPPCICSAPQPQVQNDNRHQSQQNTCEPIKDDKTQTPNSEKKDPLLCPPSHLTTKAPNDSNRSIPIGRSR